MNILRPALVLWLVSILTLAGAGCADDSDTDGSPQQAEPLPVWIDEITPRANATFSPSSGISVRYDLTEPDTEVRLFVDGVDVTAVSDGGPGLLRYEDNAEGIVRLDAGMHTAEAQLVILPTAGVDTVTVDSYTWSFRIG